MVHYYICGMDVMEANTPSDGVVISSQPMYLHDTMKLNRSENQAVPSVYIGLWKSYWYWKQHGTREQMTMIRTHSLPKDCLHVAGGIIYIIHITSIDCTYIHRYDGKNQLLLNLECNPRTAIICYWGPKNNKEMHRWSHLLSSSPTRRAKATATSDLGGWACSD